MDWLARLPGVGPVFDRVMRSRVWRAWQHYSDVHGDRFAGSVAYAGFVALFPLVAVTASVAALVLTPAQINAAEDSVSGQFGFLSDQIDLDGLVRNAGTVGVVGGVWLLLSGLGWVDTVRGSIRGVWRLEREQVNPFVRRGKDLLVLLGLGGVLAVSLGGSALATVIVGQIADGGPEGAGMILLRVTGLAAALGADYVLMVYLLRWLPGLHPSRRSLAQAALIGAAGFELLKLLLNQYLSGVAGKSMYGAFGTPVALLLWINFMSRLLLFCAAWTATGTRRRRKGEHEVECFPVDAVGGARKSAEEREPEAAPGGPEPVRAEGAAVSSAAGGAGAACASARGGTRERHGAPS